MKSQMTDLARAAWCGALAASGFTVAADAFCASRSASATPASPLPARVKKSRRDETFQ